MSIPFTQYLRPDGRTRHDHIDRPPEVEEKAKALIKLGIRFEMELLATNDVALYATDTQDDDAPLATEIAPNGPAVPEAVDKLVREAHRLRFGA